MATLQMRTITPLDEAIDYLRNRCYRVVFFHFIGTIPLLLICFATIDAIGNLRRSEFATLSMLFLLTTVWRWIWRALAQKNVQEDIRGEKLPIRFRKFPAMVAVGFVSAVAITWGSILILPALWGFFAGAFVAPYMFENDAGALQMVKDSIRWVTISRKRLFNLSIALILLGVVAFIVALSTKTLLSQLVVASLLDLDPLMINLASNTFAWYGGIILFLWFLFDIVWTVASVFLYYDLQERRMGSGLVKRLSLLETPYAK